MLVVVLLSDCSMYNQANLFLHTNIITVMVKSLTVSVAVALQPLEIPRGRLVWL